MKKIDTLVQDIYELMDKGADVRQDDVEGFGKDLSRIVEERLKPSERKPYLRMSSLGTKCDRKLWYSINRPEMAEDMPSYVKLKFLIGDVWEAVLLFLAKAAGHSVEGQQDTQDLYGVKGHRDAVIDGTVTDVKSASSRSFTKFEEGLSPERDDFGYITQLQGYLHTGQEDPLVTDKGRAAFLAGDKTLGKIVVDVHPVADIDFESVVATKKKMLARDNPPPRAYSDEADGKSGNRKLGVACSYCEFKQGCWPGLRTFLYSNGPRYLTQVVREPKVDSAEKDLF